MNFLPTLLRLCGEFFLTGLFAVGGGLATLPFLYEIGAKTGWFTEADVLDMIAVSESTPGPIGVNMATYTGFIEISPKKTKNFDFNIKLIKPFW